MFEGLAVADLCLLASGEEAVAHFAEESGLWNQELQTCKTLRKWGIRPYTYHRFKYLDIRPPNTQHVFIYKGLHWTPWLWSAEVRGYRWDPWLLPTGLLGSKGRRASSPGELLLLATSLFSWSSEPWSFTEGKRRKQDMLCYSWLLMKSIICHHSGTVLELCSCCISMCPSVNNI